MIITFIANVFYGFLDLLITALPESDGFPDALLDSFVYIGTQINLAAYLLPVTHMFAAAAVATAIYKFEFLQKQFYWLVGIIRS